MFRVTSNTLFRNSLRDIQSTAEAFARAQQQVSSGQRLQQASDDYDTSTGHGINQGTTLDTSIA